MASIRRKKRKWQPVKISFGFVIFAIMFVYMLIRIIMSLGDHDLSVFQVEESNYDTNFTATGLAVRKETLNYSSTSGYVCYYIRDGEKVAKGASVYSVDETGSMQDALFDVQNSGSSVLSDNDYKDLSKQIQIFQKYMNLKIPWTIRFWKCMKIWRLSSYLQTSHLIQLFQLRNQMSAVL